MSQDTNTNAILAKTGFEQDSEQAKRLIGILAKLDAGEQELLLEGMRTKSTAKIGPAIEAHLAKVFETEQFTTMEQVAEAIGHSMPATRGAFSGLVRDGKVAIFKKVRRDSRRLIFPAGTTLAEAQAINGSEDEMRPLWQDALNWIREQEQDGLPMVAGLAEHLDVTVSKAASTVGVLTQYGWLADTGCKVGGRKVLGTPEADMDAIAERAEIADARIKAAIKKAKREAANS